MLKVKALRILERARFYRARLEKASVREVWHRIAKQLQERTLLYVPIIYRDLAKVPPVSKQVLDALVLQDFDGSVSWEQVLQIIDSSTLSKPGSDDEFAASEEEWQSVFYGDVQFESGDIDLRMLWEPARLQGLSVCLHWLSHHSSVEKAVQVREFCSGLLEAWIDRNVFPCGVNYMSVMECGLRIPVFYKALKILEPQPSFQKKILDTIYQHAWLIERRLSLFSSLGNHTVCEALGLVYAGEVFSESAIGRRWRSRARGLLEQEAMRQVRPDGGPLEQSFSYHRFVLDVLWLAHRFMERNNEGLSRDVQERLERGERFDATFRSVFPQFCGFGDDDGGHAVAASLSPCRPMAQPHEFVSTCGWAITVFKESGYTLVQHENGLALCFDCGSLGMAPLYNHGHADALSMVLAFRGKMILTDPGTYRYNGVPVYRKYFRGTRAHNTVCIDGLDQAQQLTGFVWKNDVDVRGFGYQVEENELVLGGVCRFNNHSGGLEHKRRIRCVPSGEVVVEDTFVGEEEHQFELNYHLEPGVEFHSGEDFNINCGEEILNLDVGTDEILCRQGSTEPVMGWFSKEYGQLEPTSSLSIMKNGRSDSVEFNTRISVLER